MKEIYYYIGARVFPSPLHVFTLSYQNDFLQVKVQSRPQMELQAKIAYAASLEEFVDMREKFE